jgi:hypothetical protein
MYRQMMMQEIVERVDVSMIQNHPELWQMVAESVVMHYCPENEIVEIDGFVGKEANGVQDAGFLVITVRSFDEQL